MLNDLYRNNCLYFSQLEERMISRRRYKIASFARRQYHRNYKLLTKAQGGVQRV